MRDLKITPYADALGTVLGSVSYDLPNMQTLSFAEAEEYQELRGDDKLVATHGNGAQVNWDLEAGGISLLIWSILTGGQIIESGTTPNRKVIMRKRSSDVRPYFRVDGQIISDSGGDIVARIYRAKCNGDISGQFADGQFFVTAAAGVGLPLHDDDNDLLYDIIQHETKTTLSTTPEANPIAVPNNLTVSALLATSATINWAAITGATDYDLFYAPGPAFTAWTEVTGPISTPTKNITGLTDETDYKARVRATVGGVVSEFSTPVSFTTPAS